MKPSRAAVYACAAVAVSLLVVSSNAQTSSLTERMLRAEDSRASGAALAPLNEGLADREVRIRQHAVRALGRLERVELIAVAARLLADRDAGVRAETYNALGQLARDPASAFDVQTRLLEREQLEQDEVARGVLIATLGRLPYGSLDDVRRAEAVLARVVSQGLRDGSADALLGAARGLESLIRISRKTVAPESSTVERLRDAAKVRAGAGADLAQRARVRRLAWLSLIALSAFDASTIEGAAKDDDAEVRRLAMVAAASELAIERRTSLLDAGLHDAAGPVRYEALRGWGKHAQQTSCAPLLKALSDASAHVVLLAIDQLGNGCAADAAAAVNALKETAERVSQERDGWHQPAHAIVALAKVRPEVARALLPRYVSHPVWQVRMYAAGAARALSATDELVKLGGDSHDNVREAALDALLVLKSPHATPVAVDALGRPDYQLVLTAARALGVQKPSLLAAATTRVGEALVAALARLTAEGRDTSRDPRLAILDRLQDLGFPDGARLGADVSGALRARLGDFDPAVARKASEILGSWTGTPPPIAPQPASTPAVSLSAVDALRGARLRLLMGDRAPIELSLLVDEAPLAVLRVATLARNRHYDGLTFHRVAPNFVIQGGSPGANEYMGDGPYMRDEVGMRSHARGTVGISTRGRDTGDAQLFVNLVDSPRLDHTYTVFAEVIEGMDVADAVVEGSVIERVELIMPAKR